MKLTRILGILCFTFAFTQLTYAQTKEKIKGNRDVTIKQTYTDDFNSLIIKDYFEVVIAYNSKSSVEIEADDNLHDAIAIDVISGILNISTPYRIASKKKLSITINYSTNIKNIELYDGAELRSLTSLELDSLSLKVVDNSRAYLNINSKKFSFSSANKTRSRLNITADSTSFVLSDNSKLDAFVSSKFATYDLYQTTDATIEGTTEDAVLRLDNSGHFIGKEYTITNADVLIESNSDASLNVSSELILKASGNSETYVYNTPKIYLELFADNAKLQKKDINNKGLFN